MSKKLGLGQGVGLLFGEQKEKYFNCEISKIKPNQHQPRSHFDAGDLDELGQSIKEKGVIQPLIVSFNEEKNHYDLIAGERRLRASKSIGLSHVPVVVIDIYDEKSRLELALIENVQRTDLNPIEEAEAYRKLIETFGYTQDETSKRVGKQRTTITNLLRLLKLPNHIQEDISTGVISEGHGRALVRLVDDPVKLQEAREHIVKNGLTVRQTEKFIKGLVSLKTQRKTIVDSDSSDAVQSYGQEYAIQLTNLLNSKVSLHQNGTRGKIEIEYYSLDDLERVFTILLARE